MGHASGNPANMADHYLAPPLNTPKQTCEFCGCLYSLPMPQHVGSSSVKPNSESTEFPGNFCEIFILSQWLTEEIAITVFDVLLGPISDTPYKSKEAADQNQTDTYESRLLSYTTLMDTKMMRNHSQASAQIHFCPACFGSRKCSGHGI